MDKLNSLLKKADYNYKLIDREIYKLFHHNKEKIQISNLEKIDTNNIPIEYKMYFELINYEIDFFSKPRVINEVKQFFEDKFYYYYWGWYHNLPETTNFLNEEIQIRHSEEGNNPFENEEDFIKSIFDSLDNLGFLTKEAKDLEIKYSKDTVAEYDSVNKAILINPKLSWNFKYYVILHELMHHLNFTFMDKKNFVSEFDYWAGFREWIAIYISELLIEKDFDFLGSHHTYYLKLLQARGKAGMKVLTDKISKEQFYQMLNEFDLETDLLFTWYIDCFMYPGYKETYYPYYKKIKSFWSSKLLDFLKSPNIPNNI